jgi:hypothetical protein
MKARLRRVLVCVLALGVVTVLCVSPVAKSAEGDKPAPIQLAQITFPTLPFTTFFTFITTPTIFTLPSTFPTLITIPTNITLPSTVPTLPTLPTTMPTMPTTIQTMPTTVDVTTTTTTIGECAIDVEQTQLRRRIFIPLPALITINGTGTDFKQFGTQVVFEGASPLSVLRLAKLVNAADQVIQQFVIIMPSILLPTIPIDAAETVTVSVVGGGCDAATDTFEILGLGATAEE